MTAITVPRAKRNKNGAGDGQQAGTRPSGGDAAAGATAGLAAPPAIGLAVEPLLELAGMATPAPALTPPSGPTPVPAAGGGITAAVSAPPAVHVTGANAATAPPAGGVTGTVASPAPPAPVPYGINKRGADTLDDDFSDARRGKNSRVEVFGIHPGSGNKKRSRRGNARADPTPPSCRSGCIE
eukprot:jgi/Undpi1/1963/HiC_scaffold_12.g05350.m1